MFTGGWAYSRGAYKRKFTVLQKSTSIVICIPLNNRANLSHASFFKALLKLFFCNPAPRASSTDSNVKRSIANMPSFQNGFTSSRLNEVTRKSLRVLAISFDQDLSPQSKGSGVKAPMCGNSTNMNHTNHLVNAGAKFQLPKPILSRDIFNFV